MLKAQWSTGTTNQDGHEDLNVYDTIDDKMHWKIATFVTQMEDDDRPLEHLTNFRHTLVHAPVFEDFTMRVCAIVDYVDIIGMERVGAKIAQLMVESEIWSMINHKNGMAELDREVAKQFRIEELEAELETLRNN